MKKSLFLAVALAAAGSPAHAQTDRDLEIQQSALSALEEAGTERHRSAGANRYADIPGGPVTIAEVLRDPDNPSLNYRYARTQIADSNFRGAAASLERILLLDPGQDGVRLLYARVLYRLDSVMEAQAQLAQVDRDRLSPKRRAEASRLEARISCRGKRTNYWADVGGGLRFSSNANYAPDDEQIDAIVATPFGPFAITVASEGNEDDLAYVAMLGAGFIHQLPGQGEHRVFGAASMEWNEQVEVDSTDYNAYSANLGFKYGAGNFDFVAQALGGHLRLAEEAFLDYYAIDLRLETDLTDSVRVIIRQRSTYQDYDSAVVTSAERTGMQYDLEVGARFRLPHAQILGASVEFQHKQAREGWREFDAWIAEINHAWYPGRTIVIRNRVAYGPEDYEEANPRVSTIEREDENFLYQFRASATLGGLFNTIDWHPFLDDVRVTGIASYRRVDSNVRNFEYDNVAGELLFNKRFDF